MIASNLYRLKLSRKSDVYVFYKGHSFFQFSEELSCTTRRDSIYRLLSLVENKVRRLRCKPSRIRELAELSGAFSFDRRSYILTNSVSGVLPARLISALLRLSLFFPSPCETCERARTARCQKEGRKRFQLRYVSCTRDRTREPYFSAILCDHRS